MTKYKKLSNIILSIALTVVMSCTMLPSTVFAKGGNTTVGVSNIGTIQSFEKLEDRFISSVGENAPDHVYALSVKLNTPFEDLNLPQELTAMVERTTVTAPAEDETIPDEDKVVDEDSDTDNTVSGNEPASPSEAEEEVKEENKDEDVTMAPEPGEDEETIVTTVQQETVPVTWQSDKEYQSDENGKFIYTAVLPEDYILGDGVKLPQIYVMVGRQARTSSASLPTVGVAAGNTTIFANGNALIIEGTSDTSATVYIDANRNGIKDDGDQSLKTASVGNAPADGSDLSGYNIFGGTDTTAFSGDTLITMNSGGVATIGGGCYDASMTGNTQVNIKGGTALTIMGGNMIKALTGSSNIAIENGMIGTVAMNSASVATLSSNASLKISGGTISRVYPGNGTINGEKNLEISGGSIAKVDSGLSPKNAAGTELRQITVKGMQPEAKIKSISFYENYSYKTDGITTDTDGIIYVYLPKAGHNLQSVSVATTDSKTYFNNLSENGSTTILLPITIESIAVGPKTDTITKGGTYQFQARVVDEAWIGEPSLLQDVIWSLSGNTKSTTTLSSTGQLTVASDEATNAELTITATSIGDPSKSSFTKTKVVDALSVTVGTQTGTLRYNGTDTATFSVVASGFDTAPTTSDYTLSWFSDAAGTTGTSAPSLTVTKTSASTLTIAPGTANAGTYYFKLTAAKGGKTATSGVVTVTVEKADATVSMKAVDTMVSKNGKVGATVSLPAKPAGATYGIPTASGTIAMTGISISEDTLTYTAPASTAGETGVITIPVTAATNYNDYSITVTITSVDKTPVTIGGVAAPVAMPKYSGTAVANSLFGTPTFTPAWPGTLEYTYYDMNGGEVALSSAPKKAGSYKVKIAIPGSDATYTGEKTINFTIDKAEIIVKADDKSMIKGGTLPAFSVTYTGFVGAENANNAALATAAIAACTADGTTTGTFDITISTPAVLNGTVGENYMIKSQDKGTLTVSEQLYTVTISGGGFGAGNYAPGTIVSINAGSKSGYTFSGWTAPPVVAFANAGIASTTFTMPSNDVTITSNWTYDDDDSSDGDNDGSSSTITKPTKPVQGESNTNATVDNKGNATVNVTDKNISDAVKAAEDEASKKGVNAGEITAVISVTSPANSNANTVTVNLPKTVQDQIISNKIGNVAIIIDKPDISIGMTLATITEMNKQAKTDIQLSATRTDATKLSTEAKNAIGSRPAFDLKATYASGSKSVTNFGSGTVSVAIPYTLQKGEIAGGLYAVYVDGNGKVTHLTNSSYDAENKVLRFSTNHFSVYGIGYKAPAILTDIANHWANTDIEFVFGRGLMTGTSNTTFSPDGSMTRAMFVTALGRLANVDTNSYKTGNFTDVKEDAYYAPYVNWAASKGITSGTTAATFSPDKIVTRQEMAVFMSSYAKAVGYTVPETRAAVTFADNGSIGSWAAAAVKQMQMAGVLNSKNGNKFDPTGTATRAEVAAVLRRYVELVIDRTTTEGWTTNDSGSSMYYQNGKALTGSRSLGGTTYVFNNYGETTRKTK